MFRVAWFTENITTPVSLPDSSSVFKICFMPIQPGKTDLYFDRSTATPLHPEFIDIAGELDANLIPGSINTRVNNSTGLFSCYSNY